MTPTQKTSSSVRDGSPVKVPKVVRLKARRHRREVAAKTQHRTREALTAAQDRGEPQKCCHDWGARATNRFGASVANWAQGSPSSINPAVFRCADGEVEIAPRTHKPTRQIVTTPRVRGVSWSEVTTVPKRKSHRGLDLDLSLNSEVNIRKGWKENGGTK